MSSDRAPSTNNHTANGTSPGAMLITGAGHRIGRALALDFAARGWHIGVHYNSSEKAADEVVSLITQEGGKGAALAADLSDPDQVANLLPACQDALGPVHCLINNASTFAYDQPATMTTEQWDSHLNVNLRAPVFLAKKFADQLPEAQRGNIINIIDQRVWNLTPEFFSYTISKSGLWTATRTLAQALAPRIRVNAIGPGPVLQSIHQSREEFAAEQRATPLARGTTPREIANAIGFILDAPAMTGQMIALDGGQHLSWHMIEAGQGKLSENDKPGPWTNAND